MQNPKSSAYLGFAFCISGSPEDFSNLLPGGWSAALVKHLIMHMDSQSPCFKQCPGQSVPQFSSSMTIFYPELENKHADFCGGK